MHVTLRKIQSSQFPPKLQEIPDLPKQLYIEGELPDPSTHIYLGVVGPRKHSEYGKRICEDIIRGLHGQPIVIVSGLALGIDAFAHKTALEVGLPTIAVPGSGLAPKSIYPKSNFHLARNIVEAGGALVSEFEPEFEATPWSFPKRNRIVAGLCDAVLVVEANEQSGALITAKLALGYGRDVLAVPGSVYVEQCKGTNNLIARGAYVITSADDIISHFNLEHTDGERNPQKSLEIFTETEMAVLRLLKEPQTKNYLYEKSGLSISDCSITLSTLEIKGIIQEEYGKIYRVG
jgi:DNA processing protein